MRRSRSDRGRARRGAVMILFALFFSLICAFLALAFDVGRICVARSEAQNAADAAALAGAWSLATEDGVGVDRERRILTARGQAAHFAAQQTVNMVNPELALNEANDPSGAIVLGRLERPADLDAPLLFDDPQRFNSVHVKVHFLPESDGATPAFFGRWLGSRSFGVSAQATAVYNGSSTIGFRPRPDGTRCTLLPFAVSVADWQRLLAGGGVDNWSYDADHKLVSRGSDGRPELRIFPIGDKGSASPGNFGTVDLGNSGNSTADLRRQILEGPSAADAAKHGGGFTLDPQTGAMPLGGDTGMSDGMALALAEIIGQPRTIMLFDSVTGGGNTAAFRIVGFAGVRIVDFSLSGKDKFITAQPTAVMDSTAITGSGETSYFVGPPVRLVR